MLPFLGILAAIVAFAVLTCWDEIVDWFRDLLEALMPLIRRAMAGVQVFAKRLKDAVVEFISKEYYKDKGEWIEETTKRHIDESEVPEHILRQTNKYRLKDVTEAMEQELED